MTTDELKKEAEEYAIDNYENCLYDDLPYVNDRRAREEAYIAGAEPREKRIAELEARCNELFLQTCEQAEKIAELEKENAELKERADKADLDSVIFFNQLCKAKEIIKEFVHHYKAKTIYIDNMKDLLEQAEQFLNSEEK